MSSLKQKIALSLLRGSEAGTAVNKALNKIEKTGENLKGFARTIGQVSQGVNEQSTSTEKTGNQLKDLAKSIDGVVGNADRVTRCNVNKHCRQNG